MGSAPVRALAAQLNRARQITDGDPYASKELMLVLAEALREMRAHLAPKRQTFPPMDCLCRGKL
jgi:hypothetical protein